MQANPTSPGWFSTIATGLMAFGFMLAFSVCYTFYWRAQGWDESFGHYLYSSCMAVAAGFIWRSSRTIQFHACFWAGLCILAATLLLLNRIMAVRGYVRWELVAGPFILFTTTFGLILLMTAVCLDRPDPRAGQHLP